MQLVTEKDKRQEWLLAWEYLTLTPQGWLENYCVPAHLFYICDNLRFSVESKDTVMRNAVPTDQRIACILAL